MKYFLGIDAGGTKTHAVVSDETGNIKGFGNSGPGNWEVVGYDGLTSALKDSISHAVSNAKITLEQITAAGFGLAGYDWPRQRRLHLDAIRPLNLSCPLDIVNDTSLGILAGTKDGWGISVVAGTGCNCRGLSADHKKEARVVGGASHWSGEAAGGFDILFRAFRSISYEWTKRGPATRLSTAFMEYTGAKNLAELIEGLYLADYNPDPAMVLLVFDVARSGDHEALEVVRWAGRELGMMAVSAINQLEIWNDEFEIVLIGSLFDGHPMMLESLSDTVSPIAPRANFVRLNVPPVVGGVVLALKTVSMKTELLRPALIRSIGSFISQMNK